MNSTHRTRVLIMGAAGRDFHVFKVVERKPAARRTLEQARPVVAQRLLREKRARAQEEYVAALRSQAKIQIDAAAVASVKP